MCRGRVWTRLTVLAVLCLSFVRYRTDKAEIWCMFRRGTAWNEYFLPNEPAHWRERAEEARRVAAQLSDTQAKLALLRVADEYERLAQRASLRGLRPLSRG